MKKRILSFVLAVLMAVSIFPSPSYTVDVKSKSGCNCPDGYDISDGHVATCPLYTCPLCGEPNCYDGVNCLPDSENHPAMGKLVRFIKSYPNLYDRPNGSMNYANAEIMPAIMRVIGVETDNNGRTLYLLEEVEGTWNSIYDGYRYALSEQMEFVEIEETEIFGEVTDSEGNVVVDEDGNPLVVTVTGELPEGAVVSAVVPEVEGLGEGEGIFDIKVLLPDGTEWQPYDEKKTVVVTIPVGIEKDIVDIIHYIDYAPVLSGNSQISYYPTEYIKLGLLEKLGDSVKVSEFEGLVPAQNYFSVEVSNGKAQLEVDSFSIFYYNNGVYTDKGTGNSTSSRLQFTELNDENGKYYFVTRGSVIYVNLSWLAEFLDKIGIYKPVWTYNTSVYTMTSEDNYNAKFEVSKGDAAEVYQNYSINYKLKGTIFGTTPADVTINFIVMPELTLEFKDASGNKLSVVDASGNAVDNPKSGIFMGNTDDTPASNSQANEWIEAGKYPALNYTLPQVANVPEGYALDPNHAWYLSHDSSRTFKAGQEIKLSTTTLQVDEDALKKNAKATVTLVANFVPDDYTITYDLNGGSMSDDSEQTYTIKDVFSLPIPSKEGHTFLGWEVTTTTNSNKWKGTYSGGQSLEKMTDDVTLKAKWEVATGIPYTVEHHFQNVNRDGYEKLYTDTLTGAFDAATNAQSVVRSVPGFTAQAVVEGKVAANGQTVVKVYYNRNEVKISFNSNGGSAVESIPGYYGQPVSAPTPPTRTNYIFVGWYDPAEPGTTYVFDTFPAEDLTLVAKWNVKQSVIRFVDITNGGNGVELGVLNEKAGEPIEMLSFSKNGYTLDGWYSDKACMKKVTFSTMPETDFTVYCKWIPNVYKIKWVSNGVELRTDSVAYGSEPGVIPPAVSDRTGYNFVGWDRALPATMPANDITINAVWTAKYYKIEWVDGFGEVLKEEYLPYETEVNVTVPSDPTRVGYAFAGWDKTIPDTMPAGDVIITAKWTVNKYKITYDLDGGVLPEGATITYNIESGSFTLKNPVKAGYTFAGWTGTGLTEATMEVIVPQGSSGNRSYTATWIINTYTVDYQLGLTDERLTNAASFATAQKKTHGISLPLYSAIPTAVGAEFMGWDANDDGSVDYAAGAPYTVNSDVTLVAVWNPIPYNINYSVQGITDGTELTFSQQGYCNDTFTVQSPAVSGYHIESITVDGTKVGAGSKVTLVDHDVNVVITYAPNTYTISFDSNGGTDVDAITQAYYTDVKKPADPTREGYTFFGWYTDKALTQAYTFDKMSAENITLYAKWNVKAYSIKWVVDGEVVKTEKVNYGVKPNVTAPAAPTKVGHTFADWDTEIPATMPAKDVIITAKWDINSYNIIWVVDGKTVHKESVKYGAAPNVTAPSDPSKEGYTFGGWDKTIPGTMPAKDVIITAKWDVNSYNIIWVVDGKTVQTESVEYGAAPNVTAPSDPIKVGHTFDGWDKVIPNTMPASDITITAKWKINSYTITFDSNGGSAVDPVKVDFGADVDKLDVPTRENYKFLGWTIDGGEDFTDGNGNVLKSDYTMPASDIVLVARWELLTASYTVETYVMDTDGKYVPESSSTSSALIGNTVNTTPATREGFTVGENSVLEAEVSADGSTVLKVYYQRNKYTITFDSNGGSAVAPVTAYHGAAITAPANPTRTGYSFTGWGAVIPSIMPIGGGSFTASWNADSRDVVYNANNNTPESVTEKVHYDDEYSVKANSFVYVGYTFDCWNTTAAGDGITYKPGDTIKIADKVVLFAQWKPNTNTKYTVETYVEKLDGTYAKTAETMYGTTDTTAKVVASAKEGFTWNEDKSAMSGNIAGDGSLVLKVYYDRNTYTVTWNADGTETPESYKFGATVTAPAAPSKVGYTFARWEGYTAGMTMPAQNLTFSATWTPRTDTPYVVIHMQQNVTGSEYTTVETQNLTGTTDTEVTPEVKSYTGFKSPSAVTVNINANGSTEVVYKYDRIEYNVTYIADNKTVHTEKVCYEGGVADIPAVPDKEGCDQTAPTWDHDGKNITADTVITAQYVINKYTITATMANGSVAGKASSYDHGAAAKVIFTPDTGYKITGVTVNDVKQTDFAENRYEYVNNAMTANVEIVVTTALKSYTIKFVNEDGTVLQSSSVTHGTMPEYNGETPTKPADDQFTYTFAHWSPAIETATGDATYTATYAKTTNKYTITWVDGDGNVVDTDTMDYGTTPKYNGATPTKTATAQYTYTFKGWDKDVVSVVGDATYTAMFDSVLNSYTITWKNDNGVILGTASVAYGEMPVYKGATPVKSADAQYTYTHNGWTPNVEEVTGDAAYTATYSAVVNEYTVTFKNWDGTVLQTGKVPYGETPVYSGTTPVKAQDEYSSYTFNNTWSPAVIGVTGDAEYVAQFDATDRTYEIIWKNWDGSVLKTDTALYNDTIKYEGDQPSREPDQQYWYNFEGWEDSNGASFNAYEPVTVTGNATYTAVLTPKLQRYTVRWVVEGVVAESKEWEYGQTPNFSGSEPQKAEDNGYTYQFDCWTPVIVPVVDSVEYSALFKAVPKEFSIACTVDENGVTGSVSGNPDTYTIETPDFTLNNPVPTMPYYRFIGWSGTDISGKSEAVVISKGSYGNRTYQAHYELNTYTISFNTNGADQATLENISYRFGDTISLPTVSKTGYTFVWKVETFGGNWSAGEVAESGKWERYGNIQLIAEWVPITYTVEFDSNGGNGDMVGMKMTYDSPKQLSPNAFTRTGYHFAGWKDEKGNQYEDEQTVINLAATKGGTIILYAQWEINTVSLYINTHNSIDTNQTYIYTVRGTAVDGSTVSLTVVLGANDSQKIVNLPAGTYTISDQPDWSWRYSGQTIEQGVQSDVVVDFNYTYSEDIVKNPYWLNGFGNELLQVNTTKRKK